MTPTTIDTLMITYNRPAYTKLSLSKLLDSCDAHMRVWVWHNGDDAETLDVVRSLTGHPRFHKFHHSSENQLVREPTNWLFKHADGDLLSVIADDCVVSDGWAQILRQAHEEVPEFGIVACWHFQEDDYLPEVAATKTRAFSGGHKLMVNPWVQGSGIMIKRSCVEQMGPLPKKDKGFTTYCLRAAAAGWINGWYVPIVLIDHMDDPRSPDSMLKTDADLTTHLPLSVQLRGLTTIDQWVTHLRKHARGLQEAPTDPRLYLGFREKLRRLRLRLNRADLRYTSSIARAS